MPADGKVVGRICQDSSASTPRELRWFCEVIPGVSGTTATLDEAKAKFRA